MVRRTLFVACILLLLWAAPAAAQTYGDVVGQGQTGGVRFDTGFTVTFFETVRERGFLPATGADNLVPLVQAGIVLVGGGSLLALVARRRRAAQRRIDAA